MLNVDESNREERRENPVEYPEKDLWGAHNLNAYSGLVEAVAQPLTTSKSLLLTIAKSAQLATMLDFRHASIYGREEEIQTLQNSYDKVAVSQTSEVVLLHGYSGSGKSTLAIALRDYMSKQPKTKKQGYYWNGKYDQIRSPQPFSAIVEAFSNVFTDLSRRNDFPSLRNELLSNDASLVYLTKIIPDLATLWNEKTSLRQKQQQPDNSWSFERIKMALRDFLSVLSDYSIITVLFIDDLQWADAGSLDVIQFLLNDPTTKSLLFVGAYRDNEVDDSHPLAIRVRNIQNNSPFHLTKIKVANLDVDSVNCLVSDVTRMPNSKTLELSKAVHQKTNGNAFFTIQFLKMLQDESMLYWSAKQCAWEWNVDKILGETSVSDNTVVNIVANKISNVSKWAALVLSVAACFGSYFHSDIIVAVLENDSHFTDSGREEVEAHVSEALENAVKEGLVTRREGSSKYMFVHDKVQQGAYSLIPDEESRCQWHLRIGYLLKDLHGNSVKKGAWMLFVFTDQLNRGSSLITEEKERIELAHHNLKAALKVKAQSAFFPAANYLRAGLKMMEGMKVWEEHYNLTLDLYSTLADMTFCIGDMKACEEHCQTVFANARTTQDKHRVYMVRIDALGSHDRENDAIDFGFETLRELGENLPRRPNAFHSLKYLLKANKAVKGMSDEDILSLPDMSNETKVFVVEIMSVMVPMCYNQNREVELGLLCLRMFLINMKYGVSVHSGRILALYGFIMAKLMNFDEGYRFSKLSFQMAERFPENAFEPLAVTVRSTYLDHLRRPLHEQLDPYLKGHQFGMETGNILHACLAAASYGVLYFNTGLPLGPLAEDMEAFSAQFDKYKQATMLPLLKIVRQTVLNLIGEHGGRNRVKLTGDAMDEDEYARDDASIFKNMFMWAMRLELAYFFEDLEVGEAMCNKFFSRPMDIEGSLHRIPSCSMYVALTSMELWARRNRGRRFRKLAKMYCKDVKKWVDKKSLNVQQKLLLLQAQRLSLKKRHKEEEVLSLFNEAIVSSKKAGFTHDAALAHELTGKYFLSLRDKEAAAQHLNDATLLYTAWGAHAKVNHMLETYPFLSTENDHLRLSDYSSHRGKARYSGKSSAKHTRFDPFRFGRMGKRSSHQLVTKQG